MFSRPFEPEAGSYLRRDVESYDFLNVNLKSNRAHMPVAFFVFLLA